MSFTLTTNIVSSAASDKKKSSDKSSFDVLPLKTAGEDSRPFPAVSAVTVVIPLVALIPVSYTHLRAHETKANLVCRLLLEKKKKHKKNKRHRLVE